MKKQQTQKLQTVQPDRKGLCKALSSKTGKSDVIRMENLFPAQMTPDQKKVLKEINNERKIYTNAVKGIGLGVAELTEILNVGQHTRSARNRVHDKMAGTRAYSLLDLVVIQLLDLLGQTGINLVQEIRYDTSLQTSLNAKSKSKSDLIRAQRNGARLTASDKKGLEQLNIQKKYYSEKMNSLGLSTQQIAYIISLGCEKRSTYNRVYDKLNGQRPYSVLDMVVATVLELAHRCGIQLDEIGYTAKGELLAPEPKRMRKKA